MRRPQSGPPWPSRVGARALALLSMVVGARGRFAGNGTDARIGFQIHSANALAEWPALLRKGARSFKVDPRWLYGEEAQADDVDPDAGGGVQRPGEVFLLSHDPPLPPWDWEGRGYNYTLADLLDAITDPAGPVAAVARADPPLRIALCFKGAPPGGPCAGTGHAQRWLRAVDGFFEAAQERLAVSGLAQPEHVEFVLDGNGLPLGCLAQRWRPWASVWMNGSAPDAAFVSDVPASEGLDRFQVLNEPARVERWAYYADPHVHYGKFSRLSSPYPYQAWEPAAQATIQGLVEVFVQGPPHTPGLDFATNADVAMLQVYAGVGLNQELPSRSQSHSSPKVDGLVALLRPGLALVLEQQQQGEKDQEQQAILHAYAFDAHASLSSLRGQELVPLPPRRGLGLPGWSMKEHGAVHTMVALSQHVLWASTEQGRFLVFAMHKEATEAGGGSSDPSLRLELQQVGSLVGIGLGSAPVAEEARRQRRLRRNHGRGRGGRRRRSLSTAVLRQEGGAAAVLELFVPGDGEKEEKEEGEGCGLAYQIATVPLPGVGLAAGPSILQAPVCLWSVEEQESAGVEAAAAVALEPDRGVVVFAAAGGQVLALLLGDHDDAGLNKPCWVQIGVGDHVSAAHAPGRNESVVMLVAGGGFCYNSHLHNTGPVDVCKLHPKRTPGVLDYTYGRAREWAALLREACPASQVAGEAQAGPVKRLISACDARLLHGSYDLGTRPSLALYPLPSGEVGMLEVHGGFVASCPAEDVPPLVGEGPDAHYHWRRACDCGPALPRPGRLVADSFPLRGL